MTVDDCCELSENMWENLLNHPLRDKSAKNGPIPNRNLKLH